MRWLGIGRKATSGWTVLVWLITVIAGMAGLVRYQMTPGVRADNLSETWPGGTDIARNRGGLTLIMLVHPQCPCSVASVHELSELMSRAEGKLEAHVLFVEPIGAPTGWCDGNLWKQAASIAGVKIQIDRGGKDAAIFGASTSGEVLVYDVSGKLRFSGGITDGRGHEGGNAGYDALLSVVRGEARQIVTTPVYGCSLGVCRTEKGGRS